MYISKITLKNYKSIKDMNLSFSVGKNIIVGQNNSGKSNIISAINLVVGEKYPAKEYDDKYYYKDSDNFTIVVTLEDCINFDKTYLNNHSKKTAIYNARNLNDFTCSTDSLDEEGVSSEWKTSSEITSLIENAIKVYIILYSKKGEDAVYSLGLKNNDKLYRFKFFANDLISSFVTSAIIPSERTIKSDLVINNYSWYGKMIKKEWEKGIPQYQEEINSSNISLSSITNNIFSSLTEELNNCVKEAIPYNSIEFKLIQDTKSDFYKGIKILMDDGYYSLLDDKGSGIKSLMIIELFKLYCKKSYISSSCLIIEEPEVFLHPQARRVISKKIDEFLEDKNNQCIITTHSEQFISNFSICQLIFIDKNNGESFSYRINPDDFTPKDLEKMNIICKTENSEMFFADAVILVEGGDKYIATKIIEIQKDALFLDYHNVSVIDVGGKSFFEIYKKMLEKLNKKIFIITDFDFIKKDEVYGFLDDAKKVMINNIKSNYDMDIIKCIANLSADDQIKVESVINSLYEKNVYVLKNGELEDYYNITNIDKAKTENGISGKKITAHYVSCILNSTNISEYLNINNDYNDILTKIIENIENNI